MRKETVLSEGLAYILSKKDAAYSDGLSEAELQQKLEAEFNSMTRVEYLRFFYDDEAAFKLWKCQRALDLGESVELEYEIRVKEKHTVETPQESTTI